MQLHVKEEVVETIKPNKGNWDVSSVSVGNGSLQIDGCNVYLGMFPSDGWMIGVDVVVHDRGRNFKTYVSKAIELGLTNYLHGDLPKGGLYTLVAKSGIFIGIECKKTGIQYIVAEDGLGLSPIPEPEALQGTFSVTSAPNAPPMKWDEMPPTELQEEDKALHSKLVNYVDNELEKSIMNTNNQTKTKEGNIMTTVNRTTVTANLIDRDSGIDVEDSLVFTLNLIVQEGKVQEAIQDAIRQNEAFEDAMLNHNCVRADTVNLDALERHGREVMLREVKISDLHWEIK
jgi:hypothetical protein